MASDPTGRLAGKVAIITGATSGIGEATARLFARAGAQVVLAGRTTDKGEAITKEIVAAGGDATFIRADVSKDADVGALVAGTVERYGGVDCLFNNAGAPAFATLATVTEELVDNAMRLLVGSVLFGIKHVTPVMKERGGGSIINNASVAGWRAGQGDIVYSGAKAAVSHITHLAGVELGRHFIRVNAISPAAIATPIFWGGSAVANQLEDEANQRKQAKLERNLAMATPTPRAGNGDDIAYAALYLASDDSTYVNGVDLVVDGGRTWMFNEPHHG